MISKWKWLLVQMGRKLWVRAALFALLGLVTVGLAWLLQHEIPAGIGAGLGADAVDAILGILASSMLAVTTFSLSIMVSALAGSAESATPRATALLLQDGTTQNVLATFLGAFLFSLVGIIALKAGVYTDGGRLVVFLATLAMVAIIVLTFLRWIAHLAGFGRMTDVAGRVESAAAKAMQTRLATPYLGGHPRRGSPPHGAWPVLADQVGYVRHLDTHALSELAEEAGLRLYVEVLPGAFVHPAAPLLWALGPRAEGLERKLAAAFTLGETRSFDQDPRFGLAVLAEIASRALSPAVNDPGTAIDILGRGLRVLAPWGARRRVDVLYPRLWVPEVVVGDLFEDFFRPIARDGAALVEVQIRLQKTLLALARIDPEDFAPAAARQSVEALERAEAALALEADRAVLRVLADKVAAVASRR
ncbi:DUF2254 domain-containing protein [Acidimangrovimonas pyrenivorans]|uniref:DUF2254 domain-containing protein n=1 Tax=Acidimangrovimonas pyrenivorans TaxID=2030798 RepID=A0ABV7ABC9_9RHOB